MRHNRPGRAHSWAGGCLIRAIAIKLIDSWIDSGSIEFVEQFGVPLPVEVIAHALNVPESRMADFKRWSDDSIAGVDSVGREFGSPVRGRRQAKPRSGGVCQTAVGPSSCRT